MKLSKKQLEELRTVIQGRDEAFKSVGALEMRKLRLSLKKNMVMMYK
jgi:hypothetical protein